MSKVLRRLFSAERRTALPALMDGLAVLVVSFPLWIMFLATSNKHSLGDMAPPNFVSIWVLSNYVIMTAGVSVIAIRQKRRSRPTRTKRSWPITTLCVGLAIALGVLTMLVVDDFTLEVAWMALATTSLLGVPATLRLTAPTPQAAPKIGTVDPAAMREFGVEPSPGYDSQGYGYQAWRTER